MKPKSIHNIQKLTITIIYGVTEEISFNSEKACIYTKTTITTYQKKSIVRKGTHFMRKQLTITYMSSCALNIMMK